MTAHVLTINRNGIALASDSAVTYTNRNQHEVRYEGGAQKAVKINGNVLIALCGHATIANTPWMDLLNEYIHSEANVYQANIQQYLLAFLRYCKNMLNLIQFDPNDNMDTDFAVAGYAHNSIYPSYTFCKVFGWKRNGDLIVNIEQTREMNDHNSCSFVTFPQSQGSTTIIDGIDQNVYTRISELMNVSQNNRLGQIIQERRRATIQYLEEKNLQELAEVAKSGVIATAHYNFLLCNNRTVDCDVNVITIEAPIQRNAIALNG